MNTPQPYQSSRWELLKQYTQARIGLEQTGVSLCTTEVLKFRQAHAAAKDALQAPADKERILAELMQLGMEPITVSSCASSFESYLLRPDLGRQLRDADKTLLQNHPARKKDIVITLAAGLSATAINRHAIPFLKKLLPLLRENGLQSAPIIWADLGRVAISDPVGEALQSRLSIILIGERPGLSAPDSMGLYLTHSPKTGKTDAERNCISNIRPEGLPYAAAAAKAMFLITAALQRGLSGVSLKDLSEDPLLPDKES